MFFQVSGSLFISLPDGRQCAAFRCHCIDAHAVFHAEGSDSLTEEFQYRIFAGWRSENMTDQQQGRIHRSHAGSWRSGQSDTGHMRIRQIICLSEQLLDKLPAAFSDTHRSQSTVARMRIRSEDHHSRDCHHFSHILMQHSPEARHEDPSVLLCVGKSEHMVVLRDRSADCTQRIMAIGQYIRHGEFLQTRSLSCLQNVDIIIIRRDHSIEFQFQYHRIL